jgi:hypothetical protein
MAQSARPGNPEVENENMRPRPGGGPPRPATEPPGAERETGEAKTGVDPGSGESEPRNP